MTPLDKAREALAAVEKATAGEWRAETEAEPEYEGEESVYICHPATVCSLTTVATLEADVTSLAERQANAAAIVSAVNFVRADLPALIDENKRLADRVAKLEEAVLGLLHSPDTATRAFARALLTPDTGADDGR
jgi:hypothetical protein